MVLRKNTRAKPTTKSPDDMVYGVDVAQPAAAPVFSSNQQELPAVSSGLQGSAATSSNQQQQQRPFAKANFVVDKFGKR